MKRAVLIASVLCLGAASAFAKPHTTVFPLTAPNLPMKIASAPEQLSKALADELEGEVAKLPIDDAAGLAGCDPEATTCLETVSKNYKSKRIVFGSITMIDEGRLKVSLTRYDPGPDREQRTFTVEGSVEEMAEELIKLSRPLFGGEEEEEEEEPDGPTKPDDKPQRDDPPPTKPGTVSSTTKVVLGLGVGAGVVSAGFLIKSLLIANEVNAFKPKNDGDFTELVLMEKRGAQYQWIGIGAAGVSAVFLGYGLYRYLDERTSKPASEPLSGLMAIPVRGGATLVYSMEWQ